MFAFLKRWRNADKSELPFPEAWREIIERNVFYYRVLPDDAKRRLEGVIRRFLDDKGFEGAGGLTVTDEMRLTVAAQACILVLNRDGEIYPGLRTIILYPSAFISQNRRYEGGVMHEGRQVRLGESWDRGILVLSWSDALRGGLQGADGSNLVFHEFAHQLDDEWVLGRGTPDLGEKDLYERWHRIMSREFNDHVRHVELGLPTLIDPYGASNAAEFFAVLTELFFEEPVQLKETHPDIYALFREYYRQDPALFFPG